MFGFKKLRLALNRIPPIKNFIDILNKRNN